MSTGGAPGRPDESRALTGLRGLAAMLVLLHHFQLHVLGITRAWSLSSLLLKGYLGVDLFFVLSGFVMAMVYGPWFAAPFRPGEPGWIRRMLLFMLRRAARLWPLHAVLLCIVLTMMLAAGMPISGRTVIANVAMIQAWGISTELNPPAWSVSTEWFAYLVFPVLVPVVLRSRFGVVAAAIAIATLIATELSLAPHIGLERRGQFDIYYNYSPLPLLRCLAGFILGMTAWRLGQDTRVRTLVANGWLGAGALLLMLALMTGRTNDLQVYPLLPLAVLGLHFGTGPAARLFSHGPLHSLGLISYSFYLVHYALLNELPFGWGPLPLELLAYLAVTLGCAWLLHCAVEQPARLAIRHWGERLLRRGRAASGTEPPLRGGPRWPI